MKQTIFHVSAWELRSRDRILIDGAVATVALREILRATDQDDTRHYTVLFLDRSPVICAQSHQFQLADTLGQTSVWVATGNLEIGDDLIGIGTIIAIGERDGDTLHLRTDEGDDSLAWDNSYRVRLPTIGA